MVLLRPFLALKQTNVILHDVLDLKRVGISQTNRQHVSSRNEFCCMD